MSARLLAAMCCLLNSALCFDRPEPVNPAKREVVVYLKTARSQPAGPLDEMKREAGALLDAAGYRLSWRTVPGDPVEATIVVVELHGVCQVPPQSDAVPPLLTQESLASTAVSNGEVLPFSWLECQTISRLLAHSLGRYAKPQDRLYGRALGRLLAHELFHILTMSRDHDTAGVAKAAVSAKDILSDHFEFEAATLAKLEASDAHETSALDAVEEESGR